MGDHASQAEIAGASLKTINMNVIRNLILTTSVFIKTNNSQSLYVHGESLMVH